MKEKANQALSQISKAMKTDLHYLAKGGSWLTLGQFLSGLVSFLMAIAFARLLPKESYGIYKYIIAIAGIIGTFSLAGINTSIVQSTAKGFEGSLKQGFNLTLKWGILPFLIAVSISLYYFLQNNISLAVSMVIIGIFSPILTSASLFDSFLNGKKDFKQSVFLGTIENTISSALLLITIILTKNPVWVVAVFFSSHAVLNLILYYFVINKYKPNDNLDDGESIKYGKHLSLVRAIGNIALHLDKILVFHYIGAAELAIYSFATAIPDRLKGLTKIIPTLALPRFAEQSKESVKKNIFKKVWQLVGLTTIMVILYILLAPYIYKLLFPQYTDSILFSQVFAIVLIITGGLPGTFFNAHSATKQTYILNIFSNASRIILTFAFIIPFGIWGVVSARLISQYSTFVLSLFLLKKF